MPAPSAAVTGKLYHIGGILAAYRRLTDGRSSLRSRISGGKPFGTADTQTSSGVSLNTV
jgi:hypothetical protein